MLRMIRRLPEVGDFSLIAKATIAFAICGQSLRGRRVSRSQPGCSTGLMVAALHTTHTGSPRCHADGVLFQFFSIQAAVLIGIERQRESKNLRRIKPCTSDTVGTVSIAALSTLRASYICIAHRIAVR